MKRFLVGIACVVAGCGAGTSQSQPSAAGATGTTTSEPNLEVANEPASDPTEIATGEAPRAVADTGHADGEDLDNVADLECADERSEPAGDPAPAEVQAPAPTTPPPHPASRLTGASDAEGAKLADAGHGRRSRAREFDDAGSIHGGTIDTIDSAGPGLIGPRMRARAGPIPGHPGLYEVTLNNTGSGWEERFLIQVPNVRPPALAPMLVAFHKFGNTHWDIDVNTTFLEECKIRGWYLVAPLGATRVSYGSLESQINTRAALDFVATYFNIDRTRVYGVGFSMGGGSAVNYAARHLDPAGIMFAAVANHTGGVSHSHTWALAFDDNDVDDDPMSGEFMEGPDWLEYWFGGPPSTHAFKYQQCSAIDLEPVTEVIGLDTDLSRNLGHVPVLSWMSNTDPLVYLREQTTAFHDHIAAQNASNSIVVLPSGGHTWQTLNETQVCDYLAQFSLTIPTSGSTLADENGIYFHFEVEQDAAGAFTPFTWSLVPGQYTLNLSGTSNLTKVVVHSTAAGLDFLQPVTLNLSTSDATGDTVVLQNVPSAPSSVTRDGLPASAFYNPTAHTLEVVETDGNPHSWVLAFP